MGNLGGWGIGGGGMVGFSSINKIYGCTFYSSSF
jgi:hypothetical protein